MPPGQPKEQNKLARAAPSLENWVFRTNVPQNRWCIKLAF